MSNVFSKEELYLLSLLSVALNEEQQQEMNNSQNIDVDLLLSIAKKHAVLPFLYDILKENILFQEKQEYIEKEALQVVAQNYRLLMLTKYLVNLLNVHKIQAVILKGVSTGNLYPVPEYRKLGDVDLLVSTDTDIEFLLNILKEAGFVAKEEQHASHHVEMVSTSGVIVEIHTTLTEEFAYRQMNDSMKRCVAECFREKKQENILGISLPVLALPYHAYELLLHMLHHFLYTGFGIKLLCDWVVLWKREWTASEKQKFKELAQESGTERFAETITEVCACFLGLKREKFAWQYKSEEIPTEDFLKEIFEAEEFGKSNKERMVMMSGTGLSAYVKEFHHQMHLNFPKAGKCFLLWPVLWMVTLIKFLYNNKKVRKVSAKAVLKEAKRRSKLMEKLKLFD